MFAEMRREAFLCHAIWLFLLGLCACGLLLPGLHAALLAASVATATAALAALSPPVASAAWLVAASLSLEMTLHDLVGPSMLQATIAAVKGAEILLAGLVALRFGMRVDLCNPTWA